MAPKLTSCDVLGMWLKYWLSTEGGFVGGERLNLVGVLVWHLVSLLITGGCDVLGFCEATRYDVCWLCCCVVCCCMVICCEVCCMGCCCCCIGCCGCMKCCVG